jgi:hypothetical protein
VAARSELAEVQSAEEVVRGFFVGVVWAVLHPIAQLVHFDAVGVVLAHLVRVGAQSLRSITVGFIRTIRTVIVSVAEPMVWDAMVVYLTLEVFWATSHIAKAVYFITVVSAVILSVALHPDEDAFAVETFVHVVLLALAVVIAVSFIRSIGALCGSVAPELPINAL